MTPAHEPSAEASHKIATLRQLLQPRASRDRVAPLVTALMARDVDIHGRMLSDLRDKVKHMEENLESESEHSGRVVERMRAVEEDAKHLRQLMQAGEKRDIDVQDTQDQLKAQLTDAIQQMSADMSSFGNHLRIIEGAIEGQRRATDEVKEIIDTAGQRIAGLQGGIEELKNGFDAMPATTPVAECIVKLKEKMASYLERGLKNAEDTKSFLEAITTKLDRHENPSDSYHIKDAIEQLNNDDHALSQSTTGHEDTAPKQATLQSWPAIEDFLTIYEHFKGTYKSEAPDNDPQFIETFLSQINVHVSCALQRHLLEIYPKKVALISLDINQQPSTIFIKLGGMRWNDIRRGIPKIKDLKSLQLALDNAISGPTHEEIMRQRDREFRASAQELLSVGRNIPALPNSSMQRRRRNSRPGVVSWSSTGFQPAEALEKKQGKRCISEVSSHRPSASRPSAPNSATAPLKRPCTRSTKQLVLH
ncbi:hypothetical protein F5Y14DRAFT_70355 [Nemania sp. NC0429]|nr:hypothetical protein F5Y14DRAFT_70355 [Nemania sp. NC0429]